MTMTISAQAGTRTETESQGKEVGKDRENAIKSGLLIIAKHDVSGDTDNGYKTISYAKIVGGDIVGTSPNYAASFQMAREDLLAQFTEQETEKIFYLFLIANPTDDIIKNYIDNNTPKKDITVQSTFSLDTDGDTYWSMSDSNGAGKFLMTSASISEAKIYKSELAPGKHTTKADALHIGEVEVQRAMSRFDLAVDYTHTVFTTERGQNLPETGPSPEEPQPSPGETTVEKVTFTFDAVALINQATTANIFKEVGVPVATGTKGTFAQSGNGTTAGKYGYFHKETKTVYTTGTWEVATSGNYVFAPEQTAYTYPLFDGGTTHVGHASFFTGNSHTDISDIQEADNEFSHPLETPFGDDPSYKIWRYCMPNANYDSENQFNSNSTGIVFRAKMTGTKFDGKNDAIYAYNNIILGTWQELKDGYIDADRPAEDATVGEKEIFNMVRVRYAEALKQAKAKAVEDGDTELESFVENAATLNSFLVAQGFTIYRPDSTGNYYCYYVYWNRHNDNGNATVMNAMEFAAVRNNIYKISVNKITKLGHPGDTDDDPDPEKPDTPDEKKEFWGEITCKVLDWEVRINNVEF